MKPVSDPALLEQLEGGKAISDPDLIAKLEGGSAAPVGERFAQGLRDPVDAGAQMLTHALPGGVVEGVNKATKFVNGLPVIGPLTKALGMTPATAGQIDKGIAEREANYKAPEGVDFARLGGNLLATAPLAVASPVASTAKGAIALGAGTGGLFGGLQPVVKNQENFAEEKAKQVGLGAAFGGASAPVARGLARVISPQTREPVKTLMDAGITPTPGQILGGGFQRAEDKLRSVPILGDAITSAQRKGIEELNKAAYARVVEPIGGKVPQAAGREAVDNLHNQVTDAYNALLPKVTFKADNQFSGELQKIREMTASFPPAQAEQFERILRDKLVGRMTSSGLMSGESMKAAEESLGKAARGYRSSPDFDVRQLGDALAAVQQSMRETLVRANPAQADQLRKVNTAFANLARVEDAAGRVGAKEGIFTPAQLTSAVRGGDKSARKNQFARGNAMMQDLSDAGENVLASKYPDSGSIGRLLLGGGAIGAGVMSPHIPAGLAAASVPYLPLARQGTAALLARRPEGAEGLAELLRRAPGGLLAPAAYPALNN